MGKLWKRKPAGDNIVAAGGNGLQEVDLATLALSRPTVIYLTGFFTLDDTPGHIRGAFRQITEVLAKQPDPPDAYVWSHAGLSEIFNLAAYDAAPGWRSSRNGYDIARATIMPLVAKDFKMDAQGKVTGTPLALEDARKNLRNLTFFGYSAGTITGQETFNAALKMMQKIGFSKQDARAALSEVVMIGVGVISRPGSEKNRFTTLYLEATNDRLVSMKNRVWAPLRALFSWFAKKLRIKTISPTSAIISCAVPKKRREKQVKPDGATVEREVRGMLPAWFPVSTMHELPRYVTGDEGFSPFARIVEYSLANAAARKNSVSPLDLLAPPATVAAEDAAAYRAKIDNAVKRGR